MTNTNAPAAAFPLSARTVREMAVRAERARRNLVDSAEYLLATRDLAAEKRPKYAARMAELAADPAQVAALTEDAALALYNALRSLPPLDSPEANRLRDSR